jgi:iron-sulfur cluster repair protein YtfE (RIC family)
MVKEDQTMPTIKEDARVADVARIWPETMKIFARYKLDLCCGGVYPLNTVAFKHGLDLERLLAELNAVVEENKASEPVPNAAL